MAVDGNWTLTANTPIGELTGKVSLKSAGQSLTGTASAAGVAAHILDGTVSGNDFAGKVSITSPIALTITFTGKVSGNSSSGEIKTGTFGTFAFTGTRA